MMRHLLISLSIFGLSLPVAADEGMWTFDKFPSELVAERYDFKPDAPWLQNVQLASARLAGGCSASFVSPQGLVMTNHHCAHSCIEQLSTQNKDYIKNGFLARKLTEEKRCPEMEVNQLLSIADVTERMNKATENKEGAAYAEAQKAEMARIRQECAKDEGSRCDVVSLYKGGQYALYKYRRFQDVRLVFAPEFDIAFFGGDPYNFTFPRYALDMAFVRVYDKDKPISSQNFFPFSTAGAQENELTFISGHPGRTSREATVAELIYERDHLLPQRMTHIAEERGILTEFQKRGPEQKRISNQALFGIENGLKAMRGQRKALLDNSFFQSKVDAEQELRQKVEGNKEWKAQYGKAWDEIAQALEQLKPLSLRHQLLEGGSAFSSELFGIARSMLRYHAEKEKPNEKRLREYIEPAIPQLKQRLLSEAPIYQELEILRLSFSLTKLREYLGPDDPLVKKVLGKKSPTTLATELVKGTGLHDLAVRKKLFEASSKEMTSSKDPMIVLARLIDGDARALRQTIENDINSVLDKGHEQIAKARFAIYGSSIYPDATFTLRLSFGAVAGVEEGGRKIDPFTDFGGAFAMATGEEPFVLPPSWIKARKNLKEKTPFNFITTNDIIGGNSGSPVINQKAEIVGLVFDGNLGSLGGKYGFDPKSNRAVSVHSAAILEALDKIYGAQNLVEELRPKNQSAQR